MHYRQPPRILTLIILVFASIEQTVSGYGYSQYDDLQHKLYTIVNDKVARGRIMCMAPKDASEQNGFFQVVLRVCDSKAREQKWYADKRGRMRNLKTKSMCLATYGDWLSSKLVMIRCNNYRAIENQIVLTFDGAIAVHTRRKGIALYITPARRRLVLRNRNLTKVSQRWRLEWTSVE